MDPQTIGNITDSTLLLQAATAAVIATLTSATYDLAQGATLVNGQYAPGAGGAALQVAVPITNYNSGQTLTITASGGTYTLSLNASGSVLTTSAIAYGAIASTIAADMNALTGVSGVTVTGTGPYTITLPPALQVGGNQANPLSVGTGSLTGGSATLSCPTYSLVVNESSDGATWRAASREAPVSEDNILPTGDAYVNLMVQSRQRYLQLVVTPGGTGASIGIGNAYIQPFVNKFGG